MKGVNWLCMWVRRWRTWERQLRAIGCWAVFFAMLAFYLPVVTAIQALLQVCGMPRPGPPAQCALTLLLWPLLFSSAS